MRRIFPRHSWRIEAWNGRISSNTGSWPIKGSTRRLSTPSPSISPLMTARQRVVLSQARVPLLRSLHTAIKITTIAIETTIQNWCRKTKTRKQIWIRRRQEHSTTSEQTWLMHLNIASILRRKSRRSNSQTSNLSDKSFPVGSKIPSNLSTSGAV